MNLDTPSSTATGSERDIALCRSVFYQILSLGFRPPTGESLRRVGSAAALAEAAAILDAGQRTMLGTRALALASPHETGNPATRQQNFDGLFGHTGRPTVPPYETEYGDDTLFERPQELSDLAGFLRAFGLKIGCVTRERIDHISCELEFLAFMARKEAHAIETNDREMTDETRKATRLFLRDHLGRFVPSFAHRVMRADPDGFYGRLAGLCLELVKTECARFAVPAGPDLLRLREPIDDKAPMACGSAGDCAPGPCGTPVNGDQADEDP